MNFGKLDEHSKMNAQGTGLGLSICKQMIEKMGGSVTVNSIEGVGTTFVVDLCLTSKISSENDSKSEEQEEGQIEESKEEAKEQQINSSKSLPVFHQHPSKCISVMNIGFQSEEQSLFKSISRLGPQKSLAKVEEDDESQFRCIVANDNTFQLMAVTYNLRAHKVQIMKECDNGLVALQYVQNTDQRIDFILLDLDMPIMDGYKACEQIIACFNDKKKNQVLSDQCPLDQHKAIVNDLFMQPLIFAYSGFVNDAIRQKAKESGFFTVIEAPITFQKIQNLIISEVKTRKQNQA